MLYTGLDLHKSLSYITTVNERGEVGGQKKLPSNGEVVDFLKGFEDTMEVAIDATLSWHWLHNRLEDEGFDDAASETTTIRWGLQPRGARRRPVSGSISENPAGRPIGLHSRLHTGRGIPSPGCLLLPFPLRIDPREHSQQVTTILLESTGVVGYDERSTQGDRT